jgi:hypothetical protein
MHHYSHIQELEAERERLLVRLNDINAQIRSIKTEEITEKHDEWIKSLQSIERKTDIDDMRQILAKYRV